MSAHIHEVFYLHINGEQRGPYTVKHVDHLLNSGLINEDALFWREGLEQWQPITDLVARRRPKKRWRKAALVLLVIFLLGLLFMRLFLPITVEGWREINQREFTPKAAYWRARGTVRSQCVSHGTLVSFGRFGEATVDLQDGDGARVLLPGELTWPGGPTRTATWQVDFAHDKTRAEWSVAAAKEITR